MNRIDRLTAILLLLQTGKQYILLKEAIGVLLSGGSIGFTPAQLKKLVVHPVGPVTCLT